MSGAIVEYEIIIDFNIDHTVKMVRYAPAQPVSDPAWEPAFYTGEPPNETWWSRGKGK